MSESEPSAAPPASSGTPGLGGLPRRYWPAAAALGAALVLVAIYLAFFRTARGVYGQLLIDGQPGAGARSRLLFVPFSGEPRLSEFRADSEGYFTIRLPEGKYRIENPAPGALTLRVGEEDLEIIAKKSPIGGVVEVADELVPIPAVRVAHPGEVIGPKDGEIVMPDARLRWKPYPNAEQYTIGLEFYPIPSKMVQASAYVSGETTQWAFSTLDEVGRPSEMDVLRRVEPKAPQAAFMPGARYRWQLWAYGANNSPKGHAGPFDFSVANSPEAQALAGQSVEQAQEERKAALGALTGLVSDGRDVARDATFHVTLLRQIPDGGGSETLSDVPFKTDSTGRFTVQLPAGIYRFIDTNVRTDDSLYQRVQNRSTIVLPGTASSMFGVQVGQQTEVPDIEIKDRVRILFPTPGAKVSEKPTISWERFGESNRYHLTLMYVDEDGRQHNVYSDQVSSESVTLDHVKVPQEMAERHRLPVEGLKRGGTYRVQVEAYFQAPRRREWDVLNPPSPWQKLSESQWVTFVVEK